MDDLLQLGDRSLHATDFTNKHINTITMCNSCFDRSYWGYSINLD